MRHRWDEELFAAFAGILIGAGIVLYVVQWVMTEMVKRGLGQ